jgi:hypothetical protein
MLMRLVQTADKMAQKQPRAPMAVKMFITQPLDACHGRWDRDGKSVDFPCPPGRTSPDSSPSRIPFRVGTVALDGCVRNGFVRRFRWSVPWLRSPFAWSGFAGSGRRDSLGPGGDSTYSVLFFLHALASFGILLGPFAALIAMARKGGRRRRASATRRLGTRKISRGHRLTGSKANLLMAVAQCFRCAAPRNLYDQLPDGKPRKRKGYP